MRGEVALAEFGRLSAALLENGGEASCEFDFYRDTDGVRRLRLKYAADLVLRCERCLGRMPLRVEGESTLRLVDAETQTGDGAEDELAVGPEGIYLRDVVEDELLLALPLIPRHAAAEECEPDTAKWLQPRGGEGAIETQAENPFDILKRLKH